MSVKIPTYESTLTPNGFGVTPQAAHVEFSGAYGKAMQQVGSAIDTGVGLYKHKLDGDAVAAAGQTVQDYYLQNIDHLDELKKNAPDGAPDFSKDFLKSFQTGKDKLISSMTNEKAKKFAQDRLNSIELHLYSQAKHFETQAGEAFADKKLDESTATAAAIVAKEPQAFELVKENMMTQLANAGYTDPNKRNARAQSTLRTLTDAANWAEIKRNPALFKAAMEEGYGKTGGGFDSALKFTFTHEGGYNPKDSNGAEVNMGINKEHNPDVDVKNLTKEGATKLYRERYWDKIGGDQLAAQNPQLATAAFDTAVLAGPDRAKKLLAQAGGDVNKFIELRQQYLDGLVAKNPEKYGPYKAAWDTRTNDLRASSETAVAVPEYMRSLVKTIEPSRYHAWLEHATTAVNQVNAVDLARFQDSLTDSKARADMGITDSIPKSAVEFTKFLGPEKGQIAYREYLGQQEYAGMVSKLTTATPEQFQTMLNEHKAVDPQSAGYAGAQERIGKLTTAWANVVKMRTDDPAAYSMKYSQPVKDAFAALTSAQTPDQVKAAASSFATATLAEQQRLGVLKPQILTDGYKNQIVAQFSQQGDGGQNAAQMLQTLADTWGNRWPEVYKQLAPDLPPVAKVIGTLGPEISPATKALMASTAKMKMDDLKSGVPSDVSKDLEDKLNGAFSDFKRSTSFQVGGVSTFDAVYDSAKRLAYVYAAQGAKPSDAANKAYQEIIGKSYEFSGAARIPKGYDVNAIERGAQNAIDLLHTYDLALPPIPAGMTEKDAKSQYIDGLKFNSQSVWLTSGDEKGLVLYDAVSGTPVKLKDGRDVRFSWDTLIQNGGPSLLQKLTFQTPQTKSSEQPNTAAVPDMKAKDTKTWNK
jgi:lysozyme family protein